MKPNSRGEVATTLTIISLLIMLAGTLIGSSTVKKPSNIPSRASESCLFSSTLEVRDQNNQILSNISGFSWSNNFGVNGPIPSVGSGPLRTGWNPNLTDPQYQSIYAQIQQYKYANASVTLTLPSTYVVDSTFTENCKGGACESVRSSYPDQTIIKNIHITCGGGLTYGWRVKSNLRPTPDQQQTILTPVVPSFAPTGRIQPTRTQVVLPSLLPTATPAPCSYDARYSIKDEQGNILTNNDQTLIHRANWYWTSSGQNINFTSAINAESVIHTDKLFPHPIFKPGDYASISLSSDPAYDFVSRRINRCGSKFNRADFQCQNTREGKPLNPNINTIDGIPVACNMEIDLDWIVRKKPVHTGTLIIQTQLYSGGDLTKNIPFETRKVPTLLNSPSSGKGDDMNPYDGRSSVTVTGKNEYGESFSKTSIILSAIQTISDIPIGQHTISYNFPSGVMGVKDKNGDSTQVYRIDSPPVDGNKVNIQSGNSYTYHIIYNINTAACKAVRNSSSCQKCGGDNKDDIINPAWPNPNGKSICCPQSKNRSGFACTDDYDSRCTPGEVWYGNCGHKWGPGDQDFCPQSKRAKFTCSGDRYFNFDGCVDSPGNMNRCIEPSPTPRPTSIPRTPRPTEIPIPTWPDACGSSFSKSVNQTLDTTPPPSCPVNGITVFIISHNPQATYANISLHQTTIGSNNENIKGLHIFESIEPNKIYNYTFPATDLDFTKYFYDVTVGFHDAGKPKGPGLISFGKYTKSVCSETTNLFYRDNVACRFSKPGKMLSDVLISEFIPSPMPPPPTPTPEPIWYLISIAQVPPLSKFHIDLRYNPNKIHVTYLDKYPHSGGWDESLNQNQDNNTIEYKVNSIINNGNIENLFNIIYLKLHDYGGYAINFDSDSVEFIEKNGQKIADNIWDYWRDEYGIIFAVKPPQYDLDPDEPGKGSAQCRLGDPGSECDVEKLRPYFDKYRDVVEPIYKSNGKSYERFLRDASRICAIESGNGYVKRTYVTCQQDRNTHEDSIGLFHLNALVHCFNDKGEPCLIDRYPTDTCIMHDQSAYDKFVADMLDSEKHIKKVIDVFKRNQSWHSWAAAQGCNIKP